MNWPITFCGRREAEEICRRCHVPAVVSISDPDTAKPKVNGDHGTLRLRFHDVPHPHPEYEPSCTPRDIDRLITFLLSVRPHILIHCEMGISRSAAATMIGYYMICGDERTAANYMLASRERPIEYQIRPNTMMLEQADALLGSRLLAAAP